MKMPLSVFTLCFSSIFLGSPIIAFVLPSSTRPSNGFILDTLAHVRHCNCAAQAASKFRPRLNKRQSSLRMDDEVARKGIKEVGGEAIPFAVVDFPVSSSHVCLEMCLEIDSFVFVL